MTLFPPYVTAKIDGVTLRNSTIEQTVKQQETLMKSHWSLLYQIWDDNWWIALPHTVNALKEFLAKGSKPLKCLFPLSLIPGKTQNISTITQRYQFIARKFVESTSQRQKARFCTEQKTGWMINSDRIPNDVRFSHMFCMRCKIINTNDDFMSVAPMAEYNRIIWLSFIFAYQRQTETLTLCSLLSDMYECVWEMFDVGALFVRLHLQITMFIAVLMIAIHKICSKRTNAEPK